MRQSHTTSRPSSTVFRDPSRYRPKHLGSSYLVRAGGLALSVSLIFAGCSSVAPSASTPASGGAPSASTPASGGASSPSAALGGTINWMGFEGEDGGDLSKAWLAENNLTLKTTSTPQSDMVIAQAKLGNVIDVASVNNGTIPILAKAGLLTPLDMSRIPNAAALFQVLKDVDWAKDSEGRIVAVPLLWGDGPTVYNPAKVSKLPASPLELANPEWKGRLVWLDDPYYPLWVFAGALGYPEPSCLTQEELQKVGEALRPAIKNGVAIAGSFGELADYLVRGDADMSPQGWEAMLGMAAEKGVTLKYATIPGMNAGWSDAYVIPTTATNIDAAYAFTNLMLSPEINAKLATNLASGVANEKAFPLLSPELQQLYDYTIVKDPNSPVKIPVYVPPTDNPACTTPSDWAKVWSSLKV
jgi:spermidine/putrescine transport system substrate-binding protein